MDHIAEVGGAGTLPRSFLTRGLLVRGVLVDSRAVFEDRFRVVVCSWSASS